MAILGTGLETISYGQNNWNSIWSTNMEKLDDWMTQLWGPIGATDALGSATVSDNSTTVTDPAATTTTTLSGASGTPSTTIVAVTGTGDDANINDNFASIRVQINASKVDLASMHLQLSAAIDYCDDLKGKVNELLAELRVTGGCGVLSD